MKATISPRTWPVGAFFVYQLVVVLLLLGGLWWFTFDRAVPPPHFSWDSVLPVWVPFGGAIGGCLISMVGVATHANDWDSPRYGYWHLLRPVLGLLSASIAVLIIVFVIKGVAPESVPDKPFTDASIAVLFVFAVVVGYREATFRELVKRVGDVILGPGAADEATPLALVPNAVSLVGDVKESPVTATLTLFNGSADTLSLTTKPTVICGSGGALDCSIDDPTTALAPSAARKVTLTWKCKDDPSPLAATVTVAAGGYHATASVTGQVKDAAKPVQPSFLMEGGDHVQF
jgi:hypothetical protein